MRRFLSVLWICLTLLAFMAGCGSEKNTKLIGRWEATKVNLNGETINFSDLDTNNKEFSFEFREDGSCRTVLGGVENDGTYTFNETTVDIVYGNKTEKLHYDRGVLTLTFRYNHETTAYMFVRVD